MIGGRRGDEKIGMKISNPCVRCGKQRIVVKKWKEKIGYSVVYNTEMACPDKECQKKVESENKKQRDKYIGMRQKSEQRAIDRKVLKDAERAVRNKTASKKKK